MDFPNALKSVAIFHQLIGEKISDQPELLQTDGVVARELASELMMLVAKFKGAGDHLTKRMLISLEESAEWLEAHRNGDLVEAADAAADRLFVLLGDCIATGLPIEKLFNAVSNSNMTKFAGVMGPDGKAIKSQAYLCPKAAIRQILSDK